MTLEALPDRRETTTETLETLDGRLIVSAGFYPDGRVGEIFITSGKPNSGLDRLLDDAAVLVSKLLQSGNSPASIAAAMGKGGRSPSSLAVAMDWLAAQDIRSVRTGS